jgi:CelD/BcsL family acetyltransferase involved in cellulose biosynthesis
MVRSNGYDFEVISDISLMNEVKRKWNALLSISKSNCIFLSWEWIVTWCEVYGDRYELIILFAYDRQGELAAAAPLKIRQKRSWLYGQLSVLEFIGWGERVTPEYLDVIVRGGNEKEILPLLFDYLLANYTINAIELKPFNPESGNLEIIASHLRKVGGNVMKFRHSECPMVSLPSSWSVFMAAKSKNFRKKMKEFERVLKRDTAFSFQVLRRKDDLELFWRQFSALHQRRWGQDSKAFQSKSYLRFHKTVMERFFEEDWLRLLIVYDGSRPVAAIYCFFYNKTYFYYQSGRDTQYEKYRVGLVLINQAIQQAISEGVEVFDFLTGSETYKFRWADSVRVNYSFNYYPRKVDYLAAWLPRALLRTGKGFVNR